MKMTALVLSILAGASAWASADEPDPIRNQIEQLERTIPAKKIRRVSIVPVDKAAEGGDVLIEYIDGSTHRLSTSARAQAAQLAPDGQTFGFDLVAYYVDMKGDLWISTRAIVLYRQGQRLPFIEPTKQASVGWAFRSGSNSIMVSAQGTHGPTYLSLWDVVTGKMQGEADDIDEAKPRWTQGAPLLFCCSVKTTVSAYTR